MPLHISSSTLPCESSHSNEEFIEYPSAFTFRVTGVTFLLTLHIMLKFTSLSEFGAKCNCIGALKLVKIHVFLEICEK